MKARVLDIGCGPNPVQVDKDEWELVTLDANAEANPTVVMDITSDEFTQWDVEPFDLILMKHVLEHFTLNEIRNHILPNIVRLLKDGGRFWVIVPSLEWVAEQITLEKDLPYMFFHLYGNQQNEWQLHKWGFTMPTLRMEIEGAGLAVVNARRGVYTIGYGGEDYPAEELVVIGEKRGDNNRRD